MFMKIHWLVSWDGKIEIVCVWHSPVITLLSDYTLEQYKGTIGKQKNVCFGINDLKNIYSRECLNG